GSTARHCARSSRQPEKGRVGRRSSLNYEPKPLPPTPSPKRRGGAEKRDCDLSPPLLAGEGVGGRKACLSPPLRFGEGAGGRGWVPKSVEPRSPLTMKPLSRNDCYGRRSSDRASGPRRRA